MMPVIDPDNIDWGKVRKLEQQACLTFYSNHGCCEACYFDVGDCTCKEDQAKQDEIISKCVKDVPND